MVQWYWFGIWEIGIQFSATWFFFWGGGVLLFLNSLYLVLRQVLIMVFLNFTVV